MMQSTRHPLTASIKKMRASIFCEPCTKRSLEGNNLRVQSFSRTSVSLESG